MRPIARSTLVSSKRTFATSVISAYFLLLLLLLVTTTALFPSSLERPQVVLLFGVVQVALAQKTVLRYRAGVLNGGAPSETLEQVTVHAARDHCRTRTRTRTVTHPTTKSGQGDPAAAYDCVAFSYASPTRFPSDPVTAYFFNFSDWHYVRGGEPSRGSNNENSNTGQNKLSFIEDPGWHSYINITREHEAVPREISMIQQELREISTYNQKRRAIEIEKSSKSNKLRGGPSGTPGKIPAGGRDNDHDAGVVDRMLILLESLFYIAAPTEHKTLAAPLMVAPAIAMASSTTEDPVVRQSALTLLIVLGDSPATGDILFDAGIFPAMRTLILQSTNGTPGAARTGTDASAPKKVPSTEPLLSPSVSIKSTSADQFDWDPIRKSALDVISNICLHRSVATKLRRSGAHIFLKSLLSESGFPGLQAAMALTHIGDRSFEHTELPVAKIKSLVELLGNAIDGDIAYGIKWDLIPGPLSAIKYLVIHGGPLTANHLLDSEVMEQLFRILEADCLVALDVETALEIMEGLANRSERARNMLSLAKHSLQETEERARQYASAAELAGRLNTYVTTHDDSNHRAEL